MFPKSSICVRGLVLPKTNALKDAAVWMWLLMQPLVCSPCAPEGAEVWKGEGETWCQLYLNWKVLSTTAAWQGPLQSCLSPPFLKRCCEKSPLFKNKSLYIGCLRSIFIHVTEQLVVFPPPCPDKEGCCPCWGQLGEDDTLFSFWLSPLGYH